MNANNRIATREQHGDSGRESVLDVWLIDPAITGDASQ